MGGCGKRSWWICSFSGWNVSKSTLFNFDDGIGFTRRLAGPIECGGSVVGSSVFSFGRRISDVSDCLVRSMLVVSRLGLSQQFHNIVPICRHLLCMGKRGCVCVGDSELSDILVAVLSLGEKKTFFRVFLLKKCQIFIVGDKCDGINRLIRTYAMGNRMLYFLLFI